jgi:hypothetical protein
VPKYRGKAIFKAWEIETRLPVLLALVTLWTVIRTGDNGRLQLPGVAWARDSEPMILLILLVKDRRRNMGK